MNARAFALVATAAWLLAGCHQRKEGAAALDAGADARARTAAKTLADVQAAEQASGAPLPKTSAERTLPAIGAPSTTPSEGPSADDALDPAGNQAARR